MVLAKGIWLVGGVRGVTATPVQEGMLIVGYT